MVTEGKNIEEIRLELERMSLITAPYKFAAVTEQDIIFLERNARYMTKDQQAKLTKNIETDGFLSQLPLGMKRAEDGKYIILSGNHRCKSAIKAGLPYIIIQYIDEVDKEKALALQLSHNSIVGQDDMTVLKNLYMEIESLEAKEFSGINEKEIMQYDSLDLPAIAEGDFKLHTISFVFSDLQNVKLQQMEEALRVMGEEMHEDQVQRFIGLPYRKFVQIMSDVKDIKGVKNNTIGFVKMLQICQDYIDNYKEEHKTE